MVLVFCHILWFHPLASRCVLQLQNLFYPTLYFYFLSSAFSFFFVSEIFAIERIDEKVLLGALQNLC